MSDTLEMAMTVIEQLRVTAHSLVDAQMDRIQRAVTEKNDAMFLSLRPFDVDVLVFSMPYNNGLDANTQLPMCINTTHIANEIEQQADLLSAKQNRPAHKISEVVKTGRINQNVRLTVQELQAIWDDSGFKAVTG